MEFIIYRVSCYYSLYTNFEGKSDEEIIKILNIPNKFNVQLKRDTCNKIYPIIKLNNLEELTELQKNVGELIITNVDDGKFAIEIYDDYIE